MTSKVKYIYLQFIIGFAPMAFIVTSCNSINGTKAEKTITTTILPIKYLVEQIAGNDFEINVLVPPGSSPETFEPTPKQIALTSQSEFVFAIGLIDFEQQLSDKVAENGAKIVALNNGISIKKGSCGHDHTASHSHNSTGVDPHIWTSPRCLQLMANQIYTTIIAAYPDSVKYTENYDRLITSLQKTDSIIKNMVQNSRVKQFVVYHPALAYYAEDYGLEQISLENDGKEPSVESLKNIIEQAKRLKIKKILYQKEFNKATVMAATQDIDVECVEIDPLSGDVENNLIAITKIITENNGK